jgi:hypothetical protein
MTIERFSDGEFQANIQESVRGAYVFFIQSTFSPTENLMELLLMIDAAKRASAGYITAVIPYFGYARQDRKAAPRTPISAKLVANLITSAGADRVLTVDLHAGQIQGFFDIPLDNAHEALADARATAILFRRLMHLSPAMVDATVEAGKQIVVFAQESREGSEPRIRDRFRATESNSIEIKRALERILVGKMSLVVITGTPDMGKPAFGETLREVSLEYRETPPTMGTAFVVQANMSPGMSKIRKAQELGIPVLSESDALLIILKIKG